MERFAQARQLDEYHVFLASPGDVGVDRDAVRSYFEDLSRTTSVSLGIRFEVVDWENFATSGLGRPQALITGQTLEQFRDSLALVIVIMAQRFGSPTGEAESGTEEEVRWALEAHAEVGFPEVKFFFREVDQFVAPADPDQLLAAVDQGQRVRAFRGEIEGSRSALYAAYGSADSFASVLRRDLDTWIYSAERPCAHRQPDRVAAPQTDHGPPPEYFRSMIQAYQWLDISGIDSDRAFKLPLKQIYVRLRVIATGDGVADPADEGVAIGIQTALEQHHRLAIVGDPGSGKSTFLKFIALTLAQSALSGDPGPAEAELSLAPPLPIPLFLSCWDLAEHLKQIPRASVGDVIDYAADRARQSDWPIERAELERLLNEGHCILLIDGLDEVPTEAGRHLVSDLIEELVRKYLQHRYVVTSRVRAYNGDTVLGQNFARCDIQPFAAEERNAFLRNWV